MSNEFVVEGQWRQIQALQQEVARLKRCEEFVKDFAKYGFRIDTMPTRAWYSDPDKREGQLSEYEWWQDYVGGAEERLVDVARNVLK